jgi:hypothetical protein
MNCWSDDSKLLTGIVFPAAESAAEPLAQRFLLALLGVVFS